MTASTLTTRSIEDIDEPAVLELLGAALGAGPTGVRSADFYRWKHRDNPFGPSAGLVAVDGDRVVGVRLFLRWQLQLGGRTFQVVRAVDTATHPDYQGRGIFRRLTLDLLSELDAAGEVDLVFNTPNANSRPGYLKMGWQSVGTVPVRICPVRPVRFLRGVREAIGTTAAAANPAHQDTGPRQLVECTLPGAGATMTHRRDEIEALIAATGHGDTERLHTPLSYSYLRWRYANAPGLDYRCIQVESADRLVGLGFARMRRRGPLAELTITDLLVTAGDHRSARRILSSARGAGADHVAVHTPAGSEADQVAARAGFLRVPRYGVGLVVNPRRELPRSPLSGDSWRLSLGDLEVF